MVKLHHYHQKKFSGFTEAGQLKAIIDLLAVLESNIADKEYRRDLIPSIHDCISWSAPELQQKFGILLNIDVFTPPHDILRLINHFVRGYKKNYDEKEPEILKFDGVRDKPTTKPPYPITVILDNLRSAYNLGAIFRTAECVQAAWLYLCGITPPPPCRAMMKVAMGTTDKLHYTIMGKTEDAIRYVKDMGIPVLALETVAGAKSLYEYKPSRTVAVILGNEALGIEEKILKLADEVISIPTFGWKNSLNVSNAFTLAAYHLSGITI